MEERYTVVVNRLQEKKTLLEYIAKRLLEKETIDKQEFEDIIKAESQLPRQPALEASATTAVISSGETDMQGASGVPDSTDETLIVGDVSDSSAAPQE